ncbi:MAG: cyclic di-GMP phosphodiesterase [Pseudomonadota bacterium]|nr:cyclic di-GMP phosphodiesterase [Pseudomonadota bacterium]
MKDMTAPNGPAMALAQATILIVDDVPDNLAVLGELLRQSGYQVKVANSGRAALRFAAQLPRPDLILLDVMMPEMDGYQVLLALRDNPVTRDIPVMFLTALDASHDEQRGLDMGAADYISKPIRPSVVLARVRTQLEAKQARDLLRGQNSFLEAEVARRMAENELIQAISIRALARLAEIRDPETGNHILRTQAYVELLARRLQSHPRFAATLSDDYIKLLARSAPLHDIGKVGIPDAILQKPGKLDVEEWEIMKTHARLGAEAIEQADLDSQKQLAFLTLAREIARWHHERWDGAGYPDGLQGEAIPVSARLMALADVFDALISPRVYKAPIPLAQACEIMRAGRGSHFDPDACDAFLDVFEQMGEIARSHMDVC